MLRFAVNISDSFGLARSFGRVKATTLTGLGGRALRSLTYFA